MTLPKMILMIAIMAIFLNSFTAAQDKVVVYWGQNSAGAANPGDRSKWEKPLRNFCSDSTYDIIHVSFLHIFFDSRDAQKLPGLNFAYHCETYFPDHPFLLYCPVIGQDITYCQQQGKEIVLSLGGAAGLYGFANDNEARQFAKTVWEMFLGGNSTTLPRPFGAGVVLDGVDLDIEGGNSIGYGAFVNELRRYYSTDLTRKYVVGAAPQCVFPDYYLGPEVGRALSLAPFDYLTIQFYNNYCNLGTSGFNFDVWSSWGLSSLNPQIQIFLGAPASPTAAGSGYVDIARLQAIASELRSKYSNFGGVMLWDAGQAELNSNYGKQISDFLKAKN